MAESPDLSDAWRRAADANLRYYREWGRLAGTWLDELRGVGQELVSASARGPDPWSVATHAPEAHDRSGAGAAPAPGYPRPPAGTVAPSTAAPSLVLEAAAGEPAVGAFLVENGLGHPVEAVVTADPLTGAAAGVDLDVVFQPARLDLGTGDSTVVTVTVTVPADLPTGDHRTTIRVPDLAGTAIGLVVRRLDPPEAG